MIQLKQADFEVFDVEGLEPRMSAIIETVRPKLHQIGAQIAPIWSELTRQDVFVHVAKHARRSVNPPKDTWVAWSTAKRGYKALPHLQFGLWRTHAFLQLAVIYECPGKSMISDAFLRELESIQSTIPATFRWSDDHGKPNTIGHSEMNSIELERMVSRLHTVKKAELLVGLHLDAQTCDQLSSQIWEQHISETLAVLAPLQRLANEATR